MFNKNQQNGQAKVHVLVAPLDWGLGHATRCIPVIYELLRQGARIWLAAEGAQKTLLKKEFPSLPFIPLAGYNVRYSSSALGLFWQMLRQTPRLLHAIRQEQQWLQQTVNELDIDLVISDNRYGLYHSTIHTVFITHQLQIKSPLGKWGETILQQKNYGYINRFSQCWIPDFANEENLAGELSHPKKMPATTVKYINPLSRLQPVKKVYEPNSIFISLSGPEPQRTLLEKKILSQLDQIHETVTLVRGLPGTTGTLPAQGHHRFFNHLDTPAYEEEISKAELVICRSGYSTIMDLAQLNKKAIFISTPGQTEQTYLAKYLMGQGLAVSIKQEDFSLVSAIVQARGFSYNNNWPADNSPALANAIQEVIALIKSKK